MFILKNTNSPSHDSHFVVYMYTNKTVGNHETGCSVKQFGWYLIYYGGGNSALLLREGKSKSFQDFFIHVQISVCTNISFFFKTDICNFFFPPISKTYTFLADKAIP